MPSSPSRSLRWLSLSLLAIGCAEPSSQPTDRAAPELSTTPATGDSRRSSPPEAVEMAEPQAHRGVQVVLTREDFGPESRDPFAPASKLEPPARPVDTKRDGLLLPELSLADLTLIAVVGSADERPGRALFLGPDRRSYTVRQGSYFSRDEVRLARVGRDLVEVEGVDADGLPLDRAIALRR